MWLELLDNPAVLDVLITGLVFVLGWLTNKGIALVDTRWAKEFLAGINAHVLSAVEAGLRAYREEIDKADDDGLVTPEERKKARDLAYERALSEIGLGRLKLALRYSLGRRVNNERAKAWLSNKVDTAVAVYNRNRERR